MTRLLLRFADVDEGHIGIGGVDIRDMRTDTLIRQISCVFQDNFLFADTIANNIRLGLPEMSMEAVMAAAKVAQAHEFISALPQGYETLVGERGVFLSGGKRQRITIARAILQNRPILVLDEATAFADPENEVPLIKTLSAAMHGKTVIIVAHLCWVAGVRRFISAALAAISIGAKVDTGWLTGSDGGVYAVLGAKIYLGTLD